MPDPSTLLALARDPVALEAILRRRTGGLDETPYPLLLLAMSLGRHEGVLELRRNQLQKSIVFDDGAPIECRSNIATELLGRYLVANGRISETDGRTAAALAASRGVSLEEILTERGLLTSTELYRALQQSLGRKLLEPFSWQSGTWTLAAKTAPPASALHVRVPQLLVTGILKVEPQESADAAVASAYGKYLTLAASPRGLDELRLTADQTQVIEAARAGTAFDRLRDTGGIDTDELHRILYAFLLLGIIDLAGNPLPAAEPSFPPINPFLEAANPFVDEAVEVQVIPEPPPAPAPVPLKSEEAPPLPAAPSAAVVPVTLPPVGLSVSAASADEVMSAYLSYRRKDPLEILGVDEEATPAETTAAFLAIADAFLPSKFDEAAAYGLRDKAREFFLAAARAYAEVSDPARREELVKQRAGLREHAAVAEAGPAALIDPEALCQSGRTLAAGGKLREALSSFELAAECDAQNGTYAAEVAWCRFRLNATPATNALKLLKNAIRIDPKSGVAYLYAGQVQAALGNRLEAQAYIGRAATLLPGDPRPSLALKAAGFTS